MSRKNRNKNKNKNKKRESIEKNNLKEIKESKENKEISKDAINGEDLLKEVSEEKEDLKENQEEKKQETKKDEKTNKTKKPSKIKKVLKTLVLIVIIAFLIVLIYLAFRPKFKSITVELGKTEFTVEDFLVSSIYKNGASIVTDLNSIDLTKVQETNIVLEFKGKQEIIKLNIVDTTAPTVKFKDMMGYLDYIPNPNDFIESKEDLSEMNVEFIEVPTYSDYGTYDVKVKVSDVYGNETIGNCELMITWLIQEVDLELGSEFSVANVVIDAERFGALVPETELAKVNTMALGTYDISVDIEGKTYTSKVVVRDTTPPDLQLKDITIWDDQKINGYQDFIVSATDISGEVKTELSTQINYGTIGDQTITIKATDVNGNVTEQTATLTIRHDSTGPVIYGLTTLSIAKHASVNYEAGVYAIDEKDGNSDFTANSSSVNEDAAGTYYATYTATDLTGNTSTYKRKVIVSWDYEDVQEKVNDFYNSYCAGQDAYGIALQVNNRIKYSATSYSDRSSNIYYGLTNGTGNCKVHAYILQALFNKAGYSAAIVYLPDGAHYWNKIGETHYDSTPGKNHHLVAYSDEEKLSETWFATRDYTADQFIVTY